MTNATFTVFFGSSTESSPFMETVASWVEPLLDTKLVLWNTPEAFPASEFTFDRLMQLTKMVNAAVFIFGEDDKVWYRESQELQPRDNVLLEYGLFASRLGVRNTLVCRVAKARVSSDLLGLTTVNFRQGSMLDGKARVMNWAKSAKESSSVEAAAHSLPVCEHVARHLLTRELQDKLAMLPNWTVVNRPDPKSLSFQQLLMRVYKFPSFRDAIKFMHSAAAEIDALDHHPEWENVWTDVTVLTTTWGVGHRITDLDFRLADILDRMYHAAVRVGNELDNRQTRKKRKKQ
jgi:pterin-4a-carbinolamine dehydratase